LYSSSRYAAANNARVGAPRLERGGYRTPGSKLPGANAVSALRACAAQPRAALSHEEGGLGL